MANYKEYTVQPGDHLMAIAEKHLGAKARYVEILDRNGNKLASETIHPGDILRIPVDASPAPAAAGYFEYTVQPGDHLMAIAFKYLGNKARYTEILDRNGKPLTSETIHPGDILRVPKK